MGRRKIESRKYKSRDEFRYNYSPSSAGHPDYVFGYKNGRYKSFGLTHTPKADHRSTLLSKNPNPDDYEPSYLQHKVKTTQSRYMSSPLEGWTLDYNDRPLIRYLTKRFKKRQNKKRKNKKRR